MTDIIIVSQSFGASKPWQLLGCTQSRENTWGSALL
jgi:hypothetical protein